MDKALIGITDCGHVTVISGDLSTEAKTAIARKGLDVLTVPVEEARRRFIADIDVHDPKTCKPAARWADGEYTSAVAEAGYIADEAIKSGAVTVTDAPDPAASDIEQAIAHLRRARAAFVLAGRENDAASVLEAIRQVEGLRLEIGSE